MFALMEERGKDREEISNLDRGYISRVIGFPRDEKGKLEDDGKAPTPAYIENYDKDKRKGRSEMYHKLRNMMRREGWREWQIEENLNEIEYSQYTSSIQAAREMAASHGSQYDAFAGMYISDEDTAKLLGTAGVPTQDPTSPYPNVSLQDSPPLPSVAEGAEQGRKVGYDPETGEGYFPGVPDVIF